jgi:hypothetical protein
MRALLCATVAIVVLLAVDAIAFEGRHRHDGWREAQTQANLFSYNVYRVVRSASQSPI